MTSKPLLRQSSVDEAFALSRALDWAATVAGIRESEARKAGNPERERTFKEHHRALRAAHLEARDAAWNYATERGITP